MFAVLFLAMAMQTVIEISKGPSSMQTISDSNSSLSWNDVVAIAVLDLPKLAGTGTQLIYSLAFS